MNYVRALQNAVSSRISTKRASQILGGVLIIVLIFVVYYCFIKEEPNEYFYPRGKDNTTQFNDTNLLKQLPLYGCTNSTNLLVGIRASPSELENRTWIRNNWGKFRSHNVPVIFVIGKADNQTIDDEIENECQKYGDILVLNFHDDYRNLSLKNYGLFKYFIENCPNAVCLLKPDSDTIANIVGIEKLCNLSSVTEKAITSYTLNNTDVSRSVGNKWYVPKYVYPNTKYANYSMGWGFLITGKNAVYDLLDTLKTKTSFLTSENYRRLPDDAIQTGDVRVLANISLRHNDGFGNKKISLWTDPTTGYSYPLMMEAGENKDEIWHQFQQILVENKFKEVWKNLENQLFSNDTIDEENHQITSDTIMGVSIVCQLYNSMNQTVIENYVWCYLIAGKNAVYDLLDALKTKTPFLTSENYRRLPENSIQTGDVRVLANISLKHNDGFGIKVVYEFLTFRIILYNFTKKTTSTNCAEVTDYYQKNYLFLDI